MKIKILAIALLCFAANSFAQISDDYIEIQLDGKKAWMHKTSGYVKYEKNTKTNIPKTEKNKLSKPVSNSSVYKVTKGDTYYSISKKHTISLTQLLTWNNMTANQPLEIGKTLTIKQQEKRTNNKTSDNISKKHTVIKGETFYSISKKHSISVQDLKSKNNLTNNTLSIGQQLIVN